MDFSSFGFVLTFTISFVSLADRNCVSNLLYWGTCRVYFSVFKGLFINILLAFYAFAIPLFSIIIF